MERIDLIPTRGKLKTPPGFSYPFGAKEISSLLADVEDYEKCTLSFIPYGGLMHSQWQAAIRENREILVLACSRRGDDTNSITIYSVPSSHRQHTRTAMESMVFPEWLEWFSDKKSLQFDAFYNLASGTLRIQTSPKIAFRVFKYC